MRWVYLCFLIVAFSKPSSASQKEERGPERLKPLINRVQIITKNKRLKTWLIQKQKIHKHKAFSQKVSQEIQANLLSRLKKKKILWPEIKGPLFSLTQKGLDVSYEIKNPYQYGFILKGNKALSRHHLLTTKIYDKYFNNSQLIRKIMSHIKESYLKKGFTQIQLKYNINTDEKNFIKTVVISLKEGQRARIGKIRVFGQFSRPEKYYIRLIKKWSGSLIRKHFFYEPDIQNGIKSLTHYLKNAGWLKARARVRITHRSSHKVWVDLILKEGPLTQIQAIHFKGNRFFSNKTLKEKIKLKVNGALNFLLLEQDLQNLISTYREAGFMEMELKNKNPIQYNKEKNTAQLQFDIEEKERIKIADITVENKGQTKESFIIKTLNWKKGEILTARKAQTGLSQLNKLGIFSSTRLSSQKKEDGSPGEKILSVQVEERKPRSFRFGMGLNTRRTLTARGFGEFSHANISGAGRRFFSRLNLQSNIAEYLIPATQPKHIEHQAVLSYTEPFLWNLPLQGQLNVSNSSNIFSKKPRVTDIVNSTRAYFLLKKSAFEILDLNLTPLSWEGRREFKKTFLCERRPTTPFCQTNRLHIISTKLSLSVDKRDSLLFSKEGFLSQVFFEYAWPWVEENIQFLKMEMKHFDFQPFFDRWVWFNSLQGGIITNITEKGGVPVSRAFILGGVNSLRGFDGLIQGERVPDKEEFPIENANALIFNRSSFYLLLKTELRFSINKNMTGTLFYDGGLVTVSGKDFSRPYRHSAGLGLRYKTPLGPVSGYIAFKINPRKNETPLLPHLSFGSF